MSWVRERLKLLLQQEAAVLEPRLHQQPAVRRHLQRVRRAAVPVEGAVADAEQTRLRQLRPVPYHVSPMASQT
jgi:hypothetical protein